MGSGQAQLGEFDRRLAELAVILDEQAVLRGGLEAATAGISLDVSWLALAEDETKLLIRHLCGDRTGALRGLVLPRGWGLSGKSFAAARPFVVNDYFWVSRHRCGQGESWIVVLSRAFVGLGDPCRLRAGC